MLAVGMSQSQVQPLIEQACKQFPAHNLVIGCVNSPKSVTVSGDNDQIDALKGLLDERQVFARKLKVDVAYHSPHMSLIATQYGSKIQKLVSGSVSGNSPIMVSSVTGQEVTGDQLRNGEYWVRNMVSPVQFSKALTQLCDPLGQGAGNARENLIVHTIVEIGPHSALQGPIMDILKGVSHGEKIDYHSCLLRNISGTKSLLDTLGRLHCRGIRVDLRQINQSLGESTTLPSVLTDLPEYQFNHSRRY